MVRPRTGACWFMALTLWRIRRAGSRAEDRRSRRIWRSPSHPSQRPPWRTERGTPGSGSPVTSSARAPSTLHQAMRASPRRSPRASAARHAARQARPSTRSKNGPARSAPVPSAHRHHERRPARGLPARASAGAGSALPQRRISTTSPAACALSASICASGDRVVAADHHQQRRLEPGQGALRWAPRRAPGRGRRCRPTAPARARRRPAATSARRSSSLAGIAQERSRRLRPPRPRRRGAASRPLRAQRAREIARHRLPGLGGRRPPVLPAAAGDPLLGREGGRDHAHGRTVRSPGRRRSPARCCRAAANRFSCTRGRRRRARPATPAGTGGTSRDSVSSAKLGTPAASALCCQTTGSGPASATSGAARIERPGEVVGDDPKVHDRSAVQTSLMAGQPGCISCT